MQGVDLSAAGDALKAAVAAGGPLEGSPEIQKARGRGAGAAAMRVRAAVRWAGAGGQQARTRARAGPTGERARAPHPALASLVAQRPARRHQAQADPSTRQPIRPPGRAAAWPQAFVPYPPKDNKAWVLAITGADPKTGLWFGCVGVATRAATAGQGSARERAAAGGWGCEQSPLRARRAYACTL